MKLIYALALLPTVALAQDLTIYKCEYRIVKPGKPQVFEMSGNIVADDVAGEPYRSTYLTLAPNQLSGDTLEARILITSDGYNPITLHHPGESASSVAATDLQGDHTELSYKGENGTSYSVRCQKRPQ